RVIPLVLIGQSRCEDDRIAGACSGQIHVGYLRFRGWLQGGFRLKTGIYRRAGQFQACHKIWFHK
ncbi:MAG: hypothetical protein KDA74_02290, partial [Planctomycetaceae bacterium]|nr:hypothetical protein [Planctomycetaceae bacterium]